MDTDLIIDWSKFKNKSKGENLNKAKNSYIEFYQMLDEIDFELVNDYIGIMNKVELVYKLGDIKLNPISPDVFKRCTYKAIVNFRNNLIKNKDKFIKFIGITSKGNLIAKIKTFDGGEIEIDIASYNRFLKARQEFYSKLNEVSGYTTDFYKGKDVKMNIYIDNIRLNLMSPHSFKTQTYKTIINFKNNLKENNDDFVKFIGLSNGGSLIAQIKTSINKEICLDIRSYNSFKEGRQSTYSYCKEKGYKILSPYIGATDKILIDFNCGHEPHWTTSNSLKNGYSCPICNESKGEKVIRIYLEKK